MTPESLVQQQVEAYNARDLERFVACYSDRIEVFRPPASAPAISGKAQFAEFYASQRFCLPGLRADIVNRMVLDNKVIDHERIFGVREQPLEVVVAYEIANGLIERVWAFAADA